MNSFKYFTEVQFRTAPRDDKTMVLDGYAIRWGRESKPLYGYYVESIRRGAFTESLRNNIYCLHNHNWDSVLGCTRAGTLSLEENGEGLRFAVTLADTTKGKDAYEEVKRGDIAGVSVSFRKAAWKETKNENNKSYIEIYAAELIEVSLTPIPAYESTSVSARSMQTLELNRRIEAITKHNRG